MKNFKFILSFFSISAILELYNCAPINASTMSDDRAIKSDATTITQTIYGKIQGYLDENIYTFKGIPYAKAKRFMSPQFPDKFDGVKVCRLYGPKAPQGASLKWSGDKESDYSFGNQFNLEPMDEENCLVLNVWTKGLKDEKKRPVFLWMHGGGFASGSGIDLPCYEGKALAKKGDIVVVTVNHRLNILGYLDLSALGGKYSESVNLGQQDLVKALEWVKNNIANFGGDPNNVTIGGQSGGGAKVGTTMMMPSAKGLFNKAIVQSGSMTGMSNNEYSRILGLAVIKELGLDANTLDKINDFTYQELIDAGGNKASQKLNADLKAQGKNIRVGFSPVIDGKYIVGPSFDKNAPEVSSDVPMIIGTNLNEFCFKNDVNISRDEAKQALIKRLGSEKKTDEFINCFEKVYPGQAPKELLNTDINARRNAVKQAIAKSNQGKANVYLFLFTWKPSLNALAASHGMELPFMFNNIDLQREMTGGTDDAYKLADLMSSAWISFIKTGNPNTDGLPLWIPFTEKNGSTMIFDNKSHIENHHDKSILDIPMPGFFR